MNGEYNNFDMIIFTDLLQLMGHITEYLRLHPNCIIGAFFISGIMSGLPLIGSIFPLSAFQFGLSALGIKLGLNIFQILGILAPSLVLGDFIGYMCGYYFNTKIMSWRFFRKRKKWFEHSETIFQKYGGIAIIIGRISGPLRAVIPIIAGVFNIGRLRFLLFDIIAALLWCITHVVSVYVAFHPTLWKQAHQLFRNIWGCS